MEITMCTTIVRSESGSRCPEPSIEIRALEEQIRQLLRSIQIDPAIEAWVLDEIARKAGHVRDYAQARLQSLRSAIKDVEEQIDELTGLRIRRMITDDQFLSRRTALQQEQLRLRQKAAVDENSAEWFEPAKEIVSFSCRAAEWFVRGDEPSKRLILDSIGSNLVLRSKILNIAAKKPFSTIANPATVHVSWESSTKFEPPE